MKKIICLIATLFCYLVNQAQDVKTDLDFGDGGKVITDFGRTSTIGVEAISYPDKTIILDIGGREWHKISWTGEKDMSFGDDGVVTFRNRPPHISAIRDDGKIIAFSSYPQGQISCEVSRFLINGKPDLLFGDKGVIKIYNNLVDSVFSWENRYFKPSKLILLNEGRVLVAGIMAGPATWGGKQLFGIRLYVFNKYGMPDQSFGANGILEMQVDNLAEFGSVAVTPDSHILFTYLNYKEGGKQYTTVKVDETGIPDASFGPDGKVTLSTSYYISHVKDFWVGKDGRLISYGSYVTDWFSGYSKESWFAIQRSDGQPETTFNGTGFMQISDFYTIDFIQKGNRGFILAGYASKPERVIQNNDFEVRYFDLSNGSLSTLAGFDDLFTQSESIKSIYQFKAIDSMFLVGIDRMGTGFLMAFNKDFTPDNTFAGEGFLQWNTGISYAKALNINQSPDGKIVLAGVAGYDNEYLVTATYEPDGKEKQTVINRNYTLTSRDFMAKEDGHLFVVGKDENHPTGLIRTDENGRPDLTFGNRGWVELPHDAVVHSLKKTNDGKYLLTGTIGYRYNNVDSIFFLKLYPDGGKDLSYGNNGMITNIFPMPPWVTHQFLIHSDGTVTVLGIGNHCLIARYSYDGTRVQNFGTNGVIIKPANGNFSRISLLNDGSLVFLHVEEQNLTVDKYDSKGKISADFGNSGTARIHWGNITNLYAVVQQPDGKIIFGANESDKMEFSLARINADGSPDDEFGIQGIINTPFDFGAIGTDLGLQPDGKIIQAGYVQYEDDSDFAMVRFINSLNVGTLEISGDQTEILVYPNPVAEEAMLTYTLTSQEAVVIDIIDASGRVLKTYQAIESKIPGLHRRILDFKGLANGYYIVRVNSSATSKSVRIIVMNQID